jgi:hypothetical protein
MGDSTRVAGDERFSLEIAGMQGVNGRALHRRVSSRVRDARVV